MVINYFKNKKGFTLIEVIISFFIVSIFSIPLFSIFNMGIFTEAQTTKDYDIIKTAQAMIEEIKLEELSETQQTNYYMDGKYKIELQITNEDDNFYKIHMIIENTKSNATYAIISYKNNIIFQEDFYYEELEIE